MKLKELNINNKQEISFLETLYVEAFPPEERRPANLMFKLNQDNKDSFKILLITSGENLVGFFTYWIMSDFIFAEHFAISENFRSGGYGSRAMNLFIESSDRPIVLEVEPPLTEIAERRIGFYERLGFTLLDNIHYEQPSYYNDGKMYPMKLMSYGNIDFSTNSKEIIKIIHNKAYNYFD